MKRTIINPKNWKKKEEQKDSVTDAQERNNSGADLENDEKITTQIGSVDRKLIPTLTKKSSSNSLYRVHSQPQSRQGSNVDLPALLISAKEKRKILDEQKEIYEKELEKKNEKIIELEGEITRLVKEKTKLEKNQKNTKKSDEQTKKNEEERTKEKEETEKKLKNLVDKNTKLLKENKKLEENLNLYLGKEDKYEETEKEVKRLRKNSVNLITSSSSLNTEKNSLDSQLEKLRTDYKLSLTENELLKKKVADLKKHIGQVEDGIEEEKKKILLDPENDEGIIFYLQEQIKGLEIENQSLIRNSEEKTKKIARLKLQISSGSKPPKDLILSPSISPKSAMIDSSFSFMERIDENIELLNKENELLNENIEELKKKKTVTDDNIGKGILSNLIEQEELKISENTVKISEIKAEVIAWGLKKNPFQSETLNCHEEHKNYGLITNLGSDEMYENLRKNNEELKDDSIKKETKIIEAKAEINKLRNQLIEKGEEVRENTFKEIEVIKEKDEALEVMMEEINVLRGENERLENNLKESAEEWINLESYLVEKIGVKNPQELEDKLAGRNLEQVLSDLDKIISLTDKVINLTNELSAVKEEQDNLEKRNVEKIIQELALENLTKESTLGQVIIELKQLIKKPDYSVFQTDEIQSEAIHQNNSDSEQSNLTPISSGITSPFFRTLRRIPKGIKKAFSESNLREKADPSSEYFETLRKEKNELLRENAALEADLIKETLTSKEIKRDFEENARRIKGCSERLEDYDRNLASLQVVNAGLVAKNIRDTKKTLETSLFYESNVAVDSGYSSPKIGSDNEELQELREKLQKTEKKLVDKLAKEVKRKENFEKKFQESESKIEGYASKYNEINDLLIEVQDRVDVLEKEIEELMIKNEAFIVVDTNKF